MTHSGRTIETKTCLIVLSDLLDTDTSEVPSQKSKFMILAKKYVESGGTIAHYFVSQTVYQQCIQDLKSIGINNPIVVHEIDSTPRIPIFK